MKDAVIGLALVTIVLLAFVAIHESGHYATAGYFGLNPSFISAGGGDSNAFAVGLIGVAYSPATNLQRTLIILAALIPPFLLGGLLRLHGNDFVKLAGTAFLILAVTALIPFPGSDTGTLLSLLG